MGYGSYTAGDWSRLKNSRSLSSSSSASQTFSNSSVPEKFNAKFIDKRESFDSEDSPESTPVIIGFDVTGSMGYLANEIATNSLNETIMQIIEKKVVPDPHMMCAAFTDTNAPLQVTQFEADIRVVEQLLEFSLGGGNVYAFDNILWYFAARHTRTDCFEKRGRKGILIGIGDEICGNEKNILGKNQIKNIFGDEVAEDISFKQAMEMASERYEIIHIVVGSDFRFGKGQSYEGWKSAMPGRVIKLNGSNISCLAEVIVAAMRIIKGDDREAALSAVSADKADIVKEALEDFK